jgi:hypothetical protein
LRAIRGKLHDDGIGLSLAALHHVFADRRAVNKRRTSITARAMPTVAEFSDVGNRASGRKCHGLG